MKILVTVSAGPLDCRAFLLITCQTLLASVVTMSRRRRPFRSNEPKKRRHKTITCLHYTYIFLIDNLTASKRTKRSSHFQKCVVWFNITFSFVYSRCCWHPKGAAKATGLYLVWLEQIQLWNEWTIKHTDIALCASTTLINVSTKAQILRSFID